jgi:PPK2 family polyphosphate:nucleotide phosphotransferase
MKLSEYRVTPATRVHLKKWPTDVQALYDSEEQCQQLLAAQGEALSAQQQMLYATAQHALLIVLQGMDAAGKDGVVRHVMAGVNPQGCQVTAFKTPSSEELKHDFLWRAVRVLPERGRIGLFNRSYYEDVLIVRVHPELLEHSGLPHPLRKDKALWKHRHASIRDFERHLVRNGTVIVKIFLHLSKEEQRRRFLARIDEPDKNWKLDTADIKERDYWHGYQQAYGETLAATSSREAPWYIVPADDKANARLIVSRIVLKTLHALKLAYPGSPPAHQRALKALRGKLLE